MNLETDFARWLAAFKLACDTQWPNTRPPVVCDLIRFADGGWYMAPELRGNVVSETWGMFQNIGETPIGRACVALAYIFDASVKAARAKAVECDEPQACSPMAELATAQRDPKLCDYANDVVGGLQARHDAWRELAIARGKMGLAPLHGESFDVFTEECEAIVAKLRALGVVVE